MLVQLRRVVYLLVLLQCSVSVAHVGAASGHRSKDVLVKEMNGLAKEMHSLSNEIEEHRRNLSSEISFCERYKVHTRTLAAGNSKLAEELGDRLTAWRAKGGTEGMFREQLGLEIERTNMAVRKTKEAVARIRVTAKNTSDAVNKLKTVYKKFQSDRDEYMTLYYVMGIGGFDAKKYGVATRSKERLERALGVIKSADECSKTALQCAAGAEEGANMAGNATTLLNEKVNKILPPSEETPTHGRQEATTGQPSGELGDVSPTVAKEDPSRRDETNVDARNNGGLAKGNKRQEDGEIIKPAADDAAKQGDVNVVRNKDEQMAEKPNTEMSSQVKETMNDSSNSPALSHSPLETMNDSSNSPALLHSPLLLLVLLCVLGCTLVC